jgi:hypothetical protein
METLLKYHKDIKKVKQNQNKKVLRVLVFSNQGFLKIH